MRRVLVLGLIACTVAVPLAAAVKPDRVLVGSPGQNATPGMPTTLFVSVSMLPDYRATNPFDGDSRMWEGPDWHVSDRTGKTTLDWQVTFDNGVGSAGAMATKALVQDWKVVARPAIQVPHVVRGRKVGTIRAVALLTEGPGDNNAQYESVLAFELCKRVFVAADFALLTPVADYAASPAEPYLVEGTPSGDWNRARAVDALGTISLDGYLPAGRVTARAAGRTVTGTVRDCRNHSMPGIQVRLMRGNAVAARARAAANGSYRLTAPGPDDYRVVVTLAVTGKGGSGVVQDARSASVRVR
jgi:hypothetical protein